MSAGTNGSGDDPRNDPSHQLGGGVPEVYAAVEPPDGPSQRLRPRLEGPAFWWGPEPTGRVLLRASTRAERRLSVVAASAAAGVFGMMTVVINRDRLAVGIAAAAVIVLAGVLAVLVGWWRRVEFPPEPRFGHLEGSRRRALRRELLAGRLGDPRDRPYTRFWVGRRLRYPTNSATQIGVAGWYAGLDQTLNPAPWYVLLLWGVLAATGVVPLLLRPRWLRLAERLDRESTEHVRS